MLVMQLKIYLDRCLEVCETYIKIAHRPGDRLLMLMHIAESLLTIAFISLRGKKKILKKEVIVCALTET